jgi:hypothetical protein
MDRMRAEAGGLVMCAFRVAYDRGQGKGQERMAGRMGRLRRHHFFAGRGGPSTGASDFR